MEREIFGGEICWSKIFLKNEKEILQKLLNFFLLKAQFDSALTKKLHFPINFASLNLLSTSSKIGPSENRLFGGNLEEL